MWKVPEGGPGAAVSKEEPARSCCVCSMKASDLLSGDQSRMVKCSPSRIGSRGTGVKVAGSVGDKGNPVWVGVNVATGVIEGSAASGDAVWPGTDVGNTALQAVSKIRRQSSAGFRKRICLSSFKA